MKIRLPIIRHDQSGFEALVNLHAKTKLCDFEDIEIDLSATTWLDADMCAALGAILYWIGDSLNTVRLTNICADVATVLSKNGFLSHYGRGKISDHWGTTIPYQRFESKDDRYFSHYIETELMRRSEIPEMSVGLLKKFRESLFEIFSNAVLHSHTRLGIFSCGQFFPKRNQLDFSVADLGIGIPQNVKVNTGLELPPEQAIDWATKERNTTKRGQIPGGLGLKLLIEFIDLNGGRLQIISDAGYWMRTSKKTYVTRLNQCFPGTVVSVEINTADRQSYALISELTESDIF
ncbi:MAG: ATP-binding protein [Methylomonas sp.]